MTLKLMGLKTVKIWRKNSLGTENSTFHGWQSFYVGAFYRDYGDLSSKNDIIMNV